MAAQSRFSTLVAWLQAGPMMLVFLVFFLLPLAFVIIVSFWDYNDYEMIPTFTTRGYTETFEGCLAQLPDMCTIFKTYLSTLKFCFLVWSITLLIGFTIAYFLAFHIKSKQWQIILSLLCTIPFWTSNVIRMIAWIPLLGCKAPASPMSRRNGCCFRNFRLCWRWCISSPFSWWCRFSIR